MKAWTLDGVPILFSDPDRSPDGMLVDCFSPLGERVAYVDYDGPYPLTDEVLAASLAKLDEVEPLLRRAGLLA